MPGPALQRRDIAAHAIAELIEQLSRITFQRGLASGLNPAQWTALRYLDRVNESARHVGAFAEFHRTTPSSASQTLSALEKRGLVTKQKGEDSRRRMLALTAAGRAVLAHDPLATLAATIATLPEKELSSLAEILELLTRAAFSGGALSDQP
jgi:DNA-binding MarR family transcriptional regulator